MTPRPWKITARSLPCETTKTNLNDHLLRTRAAERSSERSSARATCECCGIAAGLPLRSDLHVGHTSPWAATGGPTSPLNENLIMPRTALSVLLCLAFAATLQAEGTQRTLFDGKTLQGWEGKAGMFRVEDGAIVAGTLKARIPNNEFLCTKQQFENFELRLKAKLIGQGNNAGIQFRSQRIPNHHEVKGYQCDMGAAGKLNNIWGSLYDESRRGKFLATGDTDKVNSVFRKDDWNEFRIRCQGPRIQIWLNGLKTVDYVEADDDVTRTGIIGLQIHGGAPAEAWYKDIVIEELKGQ